MISGADVFEVGLSVVEALAVFVVDFELRRAVHDCPVHFYLKAKTVLDVISDGVPARV